MRQLALFGHSCITVIVLPPFFEHTYMCVVCERDTGPGFGLAMYEDEIVADDYAGEWGGQPCCALCFELNRGHVGRPIEPLYGLTPLRLLEAA